LGQHHKQHHQPMNRFLLLLLPLLPALAFGAAGDVPIEQADGTIQTKSASEIVTAARVGGASANLDDTDASVEWEDATALDTGGQLATGAAVADTAFTDLSAGDSYVSFGSASDDTIDELFSAIDTAIGGLGGGHDAVTLNAALTDVISISTQELSAVDHGADGVAGWDDTEGKLTYLSAADVRTAIDVDPSGTDNSTNVTLGATLTDVLGISTQTLSAVDAGVDAFAIWDDIAGKQTYAAKVAALAILNVEDGATADQTAQEIATAIDADATAETTLKSALGLGSAAYTASTAYATSAQGSTADSAVQPGGDIGAGTATTPSADDNDTSIATTAYVQGEINGAGGVGLTCSFGSCSVDVPTRQAATDCTAETGGVTDEQCHEIDDNTLYVCESGPCNGSGWVSYAGVAGISSIVEDATPQLGGDLDLNSHVITGLQIGTDVQAYDADLTTYAGITPSADGQALLASADANAFTDADESKLDGIVSATDGAEGLVELATAAETTTGTDATRSVTPDGLAGSDFGKRAVCVILADDDTDVAVKDGSGDVRFTVPPLLNGQDIVGVFAAVWTAGTTGTTDIQIYNVTDAVDVLSTKLTIDSTENTSATAATPAVIDTSHDDLATGDELRFDVDAISTTAPKGLQVCFDAQLP
jgi:hypothetical protein